MRLWEALRTIFDERYGDAPDVPNEPVMLPASFGTLVDALMYAAVFWPAFEEMGDRIVLRGMHPSAVPPPKDGRTARPSGEQHDDAEPWWEGAGFDSWQWVQLYDLISPTGTGIPTEELEDKYELLLEEELMRILQATWSAKLHRDFPHLRFEVTVHDWDEPHGPTIHWRQVG